MESLIRLLRRGGYSCVVAHGSRVEVFTRRGVADLYGLLRNRPACLQGASVADKVVGKAAAALMILGGVERLYAEVLSRPARELLQGYGVDVRYGECVPHIVNRSGNGWCPLETRCHALSTPEECLEQITDFMASVSGAPGTDDVPVKKDNNL